MNTLLRRFAIALGVSVLLSVAFVPLGQTPWAEGVRAKRAEQRAARQRGDTPKRPRREAPSVVARTIGPMVKQAILMGVPAGLVVLLAFGIRRARRCPRPPAELHPGH